MWAEVASGFGLAAFAASMFAGWRRAHWGFVFALAALFAMLAWNFGAPPASGKIAHGLTQSAFSAAIYLLLCFFGYGLGRLVRRRPVV
jgi:hypothetical protein